MGLSLHFILLPQLLTKRGQTLSWPVLGTLPRLTEPLFFPLQKADLSLRINDQNAQGLPGTQGVLSTCGLTTP